MILYEKHSALGSGPRGRGFNSHLPETCKSLPCKGLRAFSFFGLTLVFFMFTIMFTTKIITGVFYG